MHSVLKEFNQIISRISCTYHDAALTLGLTDSEFETLYYLYMEGEGCNQSALYRLSGQRKSTINTSIKKLEKQGFLKTVPGEGRNTRVYLTEEGRILSKNTVERIIHVENELLLSWSDKDREEMLRLNRNYLEGLIKGLGEEFDRS